jgi:hypothetical protein
MAAAWQCGSTRCNGGIAFQLPPLMRITKLLGTFFVVSSLFVITRGEDWSFL